jgi:hypothetical protein
LGPVVTVTPEPLEVATGAFRLGLCGPAAVPPGTVVTALVAGVAAGG